MIGARIGRQDCLPWVEERARGEKGDPFTVTLFQDVEGRSKAHCRIKKKNYKKKERKNLPIITKVDSRGPLQGFE